MKRTPEGKCLCLMSCLNLRLPPVQKAWKSFTSKLQSKLLHKLNKPKAFKKNNKYRFSAKSAKPSRSIIFFEQKKRRRTLLRSGKGKAVASSGINSSASNFQFPKKSCAAPVYIDKLFLEVPAIEVVAKNVPAAKNVKVIVEDEAEAVAGTSYKDDGRKGGEREVGGGADDMWESLGFASPQMHGIDERAERFISTFRAEMKQQEIIAKRFNKAGGR